MVFYNTRKTMSKQWHGGKGSQRRNANDKAYADNWDKIFKKEKEVFKEFNGKRKTNKDGSDIEFPERVNINSRDPKV